MSLFNNAAKVLLKLSQQQSSIKSLILSNDEIKDKKSTFALVCESLKYKTSLDIIITNSKLLSIEKKLNPFVAQLLVYELLFGKGIKQLQRTAGKYTQMIIKHKSRLESELARLKIKLKISKNQDLIPESIRNALVLPRYIRANTLKITPEQVLQHFLSLGYTLVDYENIHNLSGKMIIQDIHIKQIFILPSNVDLHKNSLLLQGKIIIQDKASCFPAFILNPEENSYVIDACAAPGNKTSHLSAIMKNTGKIFAFDMDQRRLNTLDRLTTLAGCNNIHSNCQNFLQVDPMNKLYKNVKYVLLDPSCSGSGIVGRLDHLVSENDNEEQEKDEERLLSLAQFQKEAILHAFKFPNVEKVVYSTCSKHVQENEDVVQAILEEQSKFTLENIFSAWNTRGLPSFPQSEYLIRTVPEKDLTIGFFVALFNKV